MWKCDIGCAELVYRPLPTIGELEGDYSVVPLSVKHHAAPLEDRVTECSQRIA